MKGRGDHAAERTGRAADRAARHAFRPRRMWPGLLGALLCLAAGVLTAVEVISAWAGRPAHVVPYGRARDWAADTAWQDGAAIGAAAGLTAVGLLFLLAGVLPGRTRVVPLHGDDPELMMGVTRRGLRRAVAAAVEDAPGVSGVRRVRLRRRRVKVVAETPVRETGDLDRRIGAAARERLGRLRPLPGRSVAVRVKHREG